MEELVNFDLEVGMAKKDWIGTPAEPYYMNPEKCRELVEECGSRSAAAREIGASGSGFRAWLDPEFREGQRKYREENRERDGERRRKRYHENRDWELERNRKWREENRGRVLGRKRQHYKENRGRILERSRKYQEDPEVRLRRNMYMTRWRARRQVDNARQRAEELY